MALLQHDAYHRDRRDLAFDRRSRLDYDHPDTRETPLLIRHLDLVARGVSMPRPVYDFSVHLRAPEVVRVEPARVVVEGILVLAGKALRELAGGRAHEPGSNPPYTRRRCQQK